MSSSLRSDFGRSFVYKTFNVVLFYERFHSFHSNWLRKWNNPDIIIFNQDPSSWTEKITNISMKYSWKLIWVFNYSPTLFVKQTQSSTRKTQMKQNLVVWHENTPWTNHLLPVSSGLIRWFIIEFSNVKYVDCARLWSMLSKMSNEHETNYEYISTKLGKS